jgi:signal transduction histidine kinase
MALLLVALAILQYHWVGEVSEAARERLRHELETSADRIADDFDREVFRAFVAFQPPRPNDPRAESIVETLTAGHERWRASALEPDMVEGVYVVDAQPGPRAESTLLRLDPKTRELRAAPWPAELVELDRRLDVAASRRLPALSLRALRVPVLAPAPALLIPIRPPRQSASAPEPGDPAEPSEPGGLVIVLLDRELIGREILPALADLHLGPEPRDTELWVVDRTRREPVFTTAALAPPPPPTDSGTEVRPLLTLRFFPELRAQGFGRFFDDPDTRRLLDASGRGGWPAGGAARRAAAARRPTGGPRPGAGAPGAPRTPHWAPGAPPEQGPWALVVARTEGSLDATVSRLRRRNLGVGLAVVALLGATAGLLLVSARQVQRLARREMELVAGITHELRTPLAAIGSAADNLSDGVVREPEQIRRYGGLIKSEAHRLGALVAQVLDFAATAAGGRRAHPVEPVDVAAIVDRVLQDHRFTIEEKGFTVERRAAPDTPAALADPDLLRRAIDNVVGNALKYGEAGRWVGIDIAPATDGDRDARERGAPGAGSLAVRVSDRGPGIARADRERVFEPFYRGRAATGAHVHGIGLGLSVTRSMLDAIGASIEIEDGERSDGTTFRITLPAARVATGAGAKP